MTFAGALANSNSGGLTKIGLGTLTLAGSNAYGGGTTVSGGILQLASSAGLPGGTAATVNATLDLNTYNGILGSLFGSGTINTILGGNPTLTVGDNDASGTFSGTIQNTMGSLALQKIGAGQLVLSGTDTFNGGTTVSDGTLVLANPSALENGSSLTVGSGGLFTFETTPCQR